MELFFATFPPPVLREQGLVAKDGVWSNWSSEGVGTKYQNKGEVRVGTSFYTYKLAVTYSLLYAIVIRVHILSM